MAAKAKLRKVVAKVTKADVAVTDALSKHRHSRPVETLLKASDVADQPQLRLIGGALAAAGMIARQPRLARAGVRMLVTLELATAVKNFIKHRVDRTRPRSARTHCEAKAKPGRDTGKEVTSFPSGHTAGAVAVAQAFTREFPEYRGAALTAAGLVAVAQIPRSAHYPTDVGAGALIGAAAESLVAQVWSAASDQLADSSATVASTGPSKAMNKVHASLPRQDARWGSPAGPKA